MSARPLQRRPCPDHIVCNTLRFAVGVFGSVLVVATVVTLLIISSW